MSSIPFNALPACLSVCLSVCLPGLPDWLAGWLERLCTYVRAYVSEGGEARLDPRMLNLTCSGEEVKVR